MNVTSACRAKVGSSPLARGLLPAGRDFEGEGRIIPARAGFTQEWARGSLQRIGSSPLARGLRTGSLNLHDDMGIIPARAGFTENIICSAMSNRDHPRSRGVYAPTALSPRATAGLSPLARGLLSGRTAGRGRGRIIPARAGFTEGVCAVCERDLGSSPLARGLRDIRLLRGQTIGIIPARAGFTPGRPPAARTPKDHPRSRGVYGGESWASWTRRGSSPLARGLHVGRARTPPAAGIIPARAGFTWDAASSGNHTGDHPRSRGVYVISGWDNYVTAGSSPLARGLPAAEMPAHTHRRIIPARAGFTVIASKALPMAWDHPRSRGVYRLSGP